MKLKCLVTFLLLALTISAKSEIIDGPANVRIWPRSSILVSLNDGIEVSCFPLKNGWFEIHFTLKITKQLYEKWDKQFPNGHTIRAGNKLYDLHDRFIGVAIADIPDSLVIAAHYGGINGPVSYQMEVIGYVAKSNIKANSIPENILDSVFKANRQHLEYDTLKRFMVKHRYENQHVINKLLPKFNEYCIYESDDNSAGYRIGLIFENNDLIAIEYSRPINIVNIGGFKKYHLAHGNEILIIKQPKSLSTSALINKINEIFRGAG